MGEDKLTGVDRRPRARQNVIHGSTRKVWTGCGNLYVTVNEDEEGNLFEIFNQIGKAGGCAASQSEAIGRLVSLAFRSGIEPEDVVRQLKGISCHMPVWYQEGKILSCSDAIAKAIEWHLQDKKKVKGEVKVEGTRNDSAFPNNMNEEGGLIIPIKKASLNESFPLSLRGACPECGGSLLFEEGCVKCLCGYSDCG
jgi:ribonucleoside-diphosphate reductase alpha chain